MRLCAGSLPPRTCPVPASGRAALARLSLRHRPGRPTSSPGAVGRSPLTELDLHTSAIATLCTGDNSSHRAGLYPQPGAPAGHLGTDPAAKGAPALWYFKNTLQRTDTNQRRVRADAPAARRAHRSPHPARGDESRVCWAQSGRRPTPEGASQCRRSSSARVHRGPRLPNSAAAPAPSRVQRPDVPWELVSGPRLQAASGAGRMSEQLAGDLGRPRPASGPPRVLPRRRH